MDWSRVDKSWTLFLDRDGVINHEKAGDYIYHKGEFVLYEGVLEAMEVFAKRFGKIIITTNQRGIEKGLMTEADLHSIHAYMQQEFARVGAKVDAIYFCSSLIDDHPDRKPNPGMAFKAKATFPEIEFSKAVMVGNNLSDMEFGRNAGMYTVFVKTTHPNLALPHPAIDDSFKDLLNFAKAL